MVQKVVQKRKRDQNSPFLLDLPDSREFDPGRGSILKNRKFRIYLGLRFFCFFETLSESLFYYLK